MGQKNADCIGLEINGVKILNYHSDGKRQYFDCLCVCGKSFTTRADGLKAGSVKSCGCLTGDLISQKNRLPDNAGALNLIQRHYRNNASKRDLVFLLSEEEFKELIFGNCFYCGAPPKPTVFTTSQKNRREKIISYNGIDRIDNQFGYIRNNCVPCCHFCNGAKSDHSTEDFENWIKRLVEHNAK